MYLEQLSIKGKTALITGGGRGLGEHMAKALAEAGANVAVAARSTHQLQQVVHEIKEAGGQAEAFTVDVSVQDQVEELVDKTVAAFGDLDVVFNNAGATLVKPALQYTSEDWDKIWKVNVNGVFYGCQAAARYWVAKKRGGKIINMGSIAGLRGGSAVYIGYSTTKAAVINMTRALAVEWARYGITVNAIAPGQFDTDMTAELHKDPETSKKVLRKIPARRIGNPVEMGALALYLASKGSDFITGEVIVIDGGTINK